MIFVSLQTNVNVAQLLVWLSLGFDFEKGLSVFCLRNI